MLTKQKLIFKSLPAEMHPRKLVKTCSNGMPRIRSHIVRFGEANRVADDRLLHVGEEPQNTTPSHIKFERHFPIHSLLVIVHSA